MSVSTGLKRSSKALARSSNAEQKQDWKAEALTAPTFSCMQPLKRAFERLTGQRREHVRRLGRRQFKQSLN